MYLILFLIHLYSHVPFPVFRGKPLLWSYPNIVILVVRPNIRIPLLLHLAITQTKYANLGSPTSFVILNVMVFLVSYINIFSDAPEKSVRNTFLNFPSVLGPIPRALILRKLEPFGYPKHLSLVHRQTGSKISTSLLNYSCVLQAVVLFPYSIYSYISNLCARFLVNYSNTLMTLGSVKLY